MAQEATNQVKAAAVTRKIAVFADVHGNVTALKAVLADAKRHHVTDFWFLGDVLLPGPGSQEILALLADVGVTTWPRGNWEDLLVNGHAKTLDIMDPQRLYFTRQAMYQDQFLANADYARLAEMPLTVTKQAGGLTFRLSHNLPFKNYGQELVPTQPQENFDRLLDADVDVALYGHTHRQLVRYGSQGQLIVNPGTVGMAFTNPGKVQHDLRAMYAILTVATARITNVNLRKVEYDKDAELDFARARQLPYLDLYADQLLAGVGYTHNRPVLAAYAGSHGYVDEVQQYVATKNEGK